MFGVCEFVDLWNFLDFVFRLAMDFELYEKSLFIEEANTIYTTFTFLL